MINKLILRSNVSPYNDITKGSVLSSSELDNNQIFLKGEIIYTAQTIGNTINFNKINGDSISVIIPTLSGNSGTIIDTYVAGGTYSNGSTIFTNNTGGTFSVTGYFTGTTTIDNYWTSGSTGVYNIKANNDGGGDATGNYSVAIGYATLASGENSHAEGSGTLANGDTSHAEGFLTIASGGFSHAEGYQTTASGYISKSQGIYTIASGINSFAGGISSVASGDTSFVYGTGSQANGLNTVVFGENVIGNDDNTVYVPKLNIGIINTGTSVTTLGVDASGNVITTNSVSITGTTNFISKFNSLGNGIENSQIYDDGTNIGVNTNTSDTLFTIKGKTNDSNEGTLHLINSDLTRSLYFDNDGFLNLQGVLKLSYASSNFPFLAYFESQFGNSILNIDGTGFGVISLGTISDGVPLELNGSYVQKDNGSILNQFTSSGFNSFGGMAKAGVKLYVKSTSGTGFRYDSASQNNVFYTDNNGVVSALNGYSIQGSKFLGHGNDLNEYSSVIIGYTNSQNNSTNTNSVFVGRFAGSSLNNTAGNIYMGYSSGIYSTTGNYNVALNGGVYNNGDYNILINNSRTTTGSANVYLGGNPFLGDNGNGNNNICIGSQTGGFVGNGINNSICFNSVSYESNSLNIGTSQSNDSSFAHISKVWVGQGKYGSSNTPNSTVSCEISNTIAGVGLLNWDISQSKLIFNGARGNGNTDGANLEFNVSPKGLSGTQTNPLVRVLTLNGDGTINMPNLQVGNTGLATGKLYKDTVSNIQANNDYIIAMKA